MRVLEATTTVDIAAPMELVWKVMTDLRGYAAWNPFIVRVEDAPPVLAVGSSFLLHVRWAQGGGVRARERVLRLEPPDGRAAVLTYGPIGLLDRVGALHSERIQLLENVPGGTRYWTHEMFRGCLAPLVPMAKVRDGFVRQTEALKRHAESLRPASRGSA